MNNFPCISLRSAFAEMNKLDSHGKPVPFDVWAVSASRKDGFGKVIKLNNAIMARNVKFLDGNDTINDIQIPNIENEEWIFATDWKFYLLDTNEIKSLHNHRITHLNYMEVIFPNIENI